MADFYHLAKQEAAHRMLIEMPADKSSRAAVLKVLAEMEKHPDDPDPDSGAKFLHVPLTKELDL